MAEPKPKKRYVRKAKPVLDPVALAADPENAPAPVTDGRTGERELTWRQRLLVKFMLNESKGNWTDAARRAGYSDPGQSAYDCKQNATILAAIASGAEAAMGSDEILSRLAEQATGLPVEVFHDSGNVDFKKLKELGLTHLVKKVTRGKAGLSFEFYDAQRAIELLGKHLALFTEKIDITTLDVASMTDEELAAIAKKR